MWGEVTAKKTKQQNKTKTKQVTAVRGGKTRLYEMICLTLGQEAGFVSVDFLTLTSGRLWLDDWPSTPCLYHTADHFPFRYLYPANVFTFEVIAFLSYGCLYPPDYHLRSRCFHSWDDHAAYRCTYTAYVCNLQMITQSAVSLYRRCL